MGGEGYPCFIIFKSLNISETVKAIKLPFRDMEEILNRGTHAKFGIPYLLQSSYIERNSDGVLYILGFLFQFFINENCYNSTTSNNIGVKFETLSKFENKNTIVSKKFNKNVMLANYDIIFLILI